VSLDLDSLAVALVNAAPDAVFVVDEGGVILVVNDEAERMFGYARDELIGHTIDLLVPETVRDRHGGYRHTYASAPTRRPMGAFEVSAQRKDGSEVWIAVSLSPLEIDGRRLVISIARDVSERRQMQERLRYLGSHDALTSLYNRAYFDEELARLERGRVFPVSLVVADLDELKQVNDSSGHAGGDLLLQRAAAVLRAAFRAEDVVARLGGDEFSVILPGVGADDLQVAIARTRHSADAAGVALSIGCASAYSGGEIQRALQQADRAMYVDKAERRATRAATGSGS